MSDPLFQPITLGDLHLPNRIIMSPMTRTRAGAGDVPTDLMVEYYRQRASAGLIVTEGTSPSAEAKGYWRMPEKTAEEFTADGFFKTGDVGKIDDRGYVTIVGRSKDLIISGGYNVYPAEIESTINDMPGVSESAVIGVPHPDFGEVGVAVLILKPNATLTPDDVIANLKATLANFKIPKRCFALSELPRNTMGKVQKNVLREQYKGLFI